MSAARLALQHEVVQRLVRISELWKNVAWGVSSGDAAMQYDDRHRAEGVDDAEAIGSRTRPVHVGQTEEWHRPMLDFDFPVAAVPSSTPGHTHVYIDRALTWEQYEKVLRVLGEVGLLEEGYVRASIARRSTFLRLPWVKKGREKECTTPTLSDVEAFLAEPTGDPAPPDPWNVPNPSAWADLF